MAYWDHCTNRGRQPVRSLGSKSVPDKLRSKDISAEWPAAHQVQKCQCKCERNYFMLFGLQWVLTNHCYGKISPPRAHLATSKAIFFSVLETGAGGMSSRNWGLASCTAQQNSHQEYLVPKVSSASPNSPSAHCFLSLPLLPLSSTEQSTLESHFSQGTQNLVGETTTHWNNYHSTRLDGSPGDKLWS